jgi:putative Mn2+ efflux pump MntP
VKKFLSDLIGQIWTLLGMFVAWLVLEGSAKTIVGYAIVGSLGVWMITFGLRNAVDKNDDDDNKTQLESRD